MSRNNKSPRFPGSVSHNFPGDNESFGQNISESVFDIFTNVDGTSDPIGNNSIRDATDISANSCKKPPKLTVQNNHSQSDREE